MGRTKRLRQRKRYDVTADKYSPAVCLFKYLGQFDWNNRTKLMCRNFPTTGRGLSSKIGISSGDVLIELPLEAMITLATLENDKDFRDITEDLRTSLKSVTFQSLLALYIMYRKHLGDNESSLFLYINSIPETFSTPYFCQNDELYFLPEAILQQTVEQNRQIRESYKIFKKAFDSKVCKCCGQSYMRDIFTLINFKWAYFAVNSRSIFISRNKIESLIHGESCYRQMLTDEPDMALAPFLDMFNHIDTASTEPRIVTEHSDLLFQLITNDSYKAYEQIFITYGNLTNLKLLTEYGFSLEHNVHDYFEITLVDIEALIKNDRTFKGIILHSNKFKFIRDHNLNDQMFIHAIDGLSHNLQVTLYLIFKETSHFPNVLNQSAFGSNVVFEESIQREARLLTLYKIKEYQRFIEGFSKLNNLTPSAQATVQYLTHSITHLQTYLDKFS